LLVGIFLFGLIGLPATTTLASSPNAVASDVALQLYNWQRAYLKWHPYAPFSGKDITMPYGNGAAAGPLWSFATTQQSPVTSGLACLLCLVQHPTQAIDGDTTTYSTLTLPVGIAATLGQRLTFPGDYLAGDYIALELEVPNQAVAGQLLGGINIVTYNNGTSNADQTFLNGSIVKVELLGIGNVTTGKFRALVPVKHNFNAVQINITSALAALGNLRIYEVVAGVPPTITPANPVITRGQQASLTASSRLANAAFKWYTSPRGGTPVFTGATYNTPALDSNTTFYVETTTTNNNLTSYLRTPVTVTVVKGPGPLWTYGIEQQSPRTGGIACALCSVQDPELAIDGDTTTRSRLTMPLGVAATVGQYIGFPARYQAGDSIVLFLSTEADLLANTSLLGGIQVQTFRGDTANNDAATLNPALVNLQLLGASDGLNHFRITFAATRPFDGTQVDLLSLAGLANGLYIGEAAAMMPVQVTRINPASDTILAGETASFEAAIPRIPDATFSWYETPTGGKPVFSGVNFTTPPLLENKTYYVAAYSPADGLHSLIRTAVPITVTAVNELLCGAATTQSAGTAGIACLGCSVINPQLAVDNDPATSSELRVGIGLLGGVFQGLGFPSVTGIADTLRVGVSTSSQVLDLGLLTGITFTLYNGNTQVQQINNPSLLTLRLPDDSSYSELVIAPGLAFDSVKIDFNALLAAVSNVRIHYAKATAPDARVQDSVLRTCAGGSVTFNAIFPAGATFRWYAAYTGGTPLFTGASFTASNITSDTTFFVEAVSTGTGACGSNTRTPVSVKLGLPDVAVTPSTIKINKGQSATFNVISPQPAYTYRWYAVDTGGVALSTGTQFITPAIDAASVFYAEADSAGCTSKRTAVYVTVSTAPAAPVIIPDTVFVSTGQTATFQIATPDPALTYRWYNTDSGGTVLGTDTMYTTPAVTANGYVYAEAVNASNEVSPRARAVVRLTDAPGSGPCTYAGAQKSPVYTAPISICLLCGVTNPLNAVDGDTTTASQIRANVGVGYIGQVMSFRQPGLAGDSIRLTLSLPTGLADVQLLGGVRVQTYSGDTPAGNPVFLNGGMGLVKLQLINGNKFTASFAAPANYDAVYVSIGGVLTALTTLEVFAAEQRLVPAKPSADTDSLNLCLGASARLVATDTTGVTVKWYANATGGTALATGGIFNTPALTQALTTYYIETSRNGCPNPVRMPVTVNAKNCGNPGSDTTAITICRGTSTALGVDSVQTGATYEWYNTANNSLVFTGVNFTTPVLNANITYRLEAAFAGGLRDTVQIYAITVTDPPVVPVLVNGSVISCAGGPVQLQVQNPQAGITYNWYDAPTGGNLVGTGVTLTVTPPAGQDSVKYYAGAAVATCSSTSRAVATVRTINNLQPPVLTTNQQSVNLGETVIFTVANPQAGITYRWYSTATGGTPLAIGPSFTTPPLAADSAKYYVEASAGSCVSGARAMLTVKKNNNGGGKGDTTDITLCTGSSIMLNVVNPQGGVIYRWYNTANNSLVFTGTSFTTPVLNASITYLVEETLPGGAKDTNHVYRITVANNATPPVVVSNLVKVCSGQDATLIVQNPQPGFTYLWYDAASGGSLVYTGPVYTVAAVTGNRDYYVQSVLNNKCASATRTKVSIQASSTPPAPVVSSNNVATCISGTATFNIQNPDPAVTYRWYNQPANGTLLAIGTAYTTAGLTNTTTFYVEAAYNAGCVSTVRTGVTATVVNTLDAPLADAATVCSGQSAVLTVKNPGAGLIYRWYSSATGGSPLFTGNAYTTPPRSANTVYYLEAASGSGCVSVSRTAVNVIVNGLPAAPQVSSSNVQICPGQTATLEIQSPNATLSYHWYTSPTGGTPVTTGTSVTTDALNSNQQYYVEAVNASACASSARTPVSVTVAAPNANDIVVDVPDPECPGVVTLTASAPTVTDPEFRWFSTATGGTQLSTGAVFTTSSLSQNTTYYVEVSTKRGCTSTGRKAVTVGVLQQLATPVVTVSDSTATSVSFRWNNVPGATRYEVSTDNGATFVPPSSGANGTTHTVAALSPNQSVTLVVRAVNTNNCQTSERSAAITGSAANPAGNQVFIPNMFSPNGDGVNDVFMVYGNAIASMEMHIYNAWGQEVFMSKDLRQGWNGAMSGKMQPAGVYVYIVMVKLQNGTTVNRKGNITIIR
jgi:gliding motility-associated-like protein